MRLGRPPTVAREAGRRAWAQALPFLYPVFWLACWWIAPAYWFLPAGVRFAALWMSPPRRWGWFALADIAAVALSIAITAAPLPLPGLLLAAVMPWCACALAIALVRPGAVFAAPESPAAMAATLVAMLTAAFAGGVVDGLLALVTTAASGVGWLENVLASAIGAYAGMLTLVPLAFLLRPRRALDDERGPMLRELLLMSVPLLLLLAALWRWQAPVLPYVALLTLLPLMLSAFRHGWRGAAAAGALAAAALEMVATRIEPLLPPAALHGVLAVVASAALLLGSASETLRRVNVALTERSRQDRAANERLAAQADALRDLSRRLVRAREDEQRRLAHELHDELGQSVAALGTRLGLLARRTDEPELLAALHAQRELVQHIQTGIRDVLQGLRPAILDRFGLEVALREGPLQRMLDDAAIHYEPRISGPVDRVGGDTGSAVYRICQEAATNCVKHAQARRFALQLDIAPTWNGDLELHLRIEDDGRGFDPQRVEQQSLGGGLRGIRDRVMALAGEYRCESGSDGTRHLVWFVDRQPHA